MAFSIAIDGPAGAGVIIQKKHLEVFVYKQKKS